jgi:hypothetical protein
VVVTTKVVCLWRSGVGLHHLAPYVLYELVYASACGTLINILCLFQLPVVDVRQYRGGAAGVFH